MNKVTPYSRRNPNARALALALALLFSLSPLCELRADEPVRIGAAKQLLVDDYVIAELKGVSRIFNPAEKHINNPVLRGEKPWEGKMVNLGTVLYDQEEGLFKMWYFSLDIKFKVPPKPYNQYKNLLTAAEYQEKVAMCYATSKDGLNWDRPNLGLVEFQGSTANNLLPPVKDGSMHCSSSIIKDLREPDASRRYKSVAWRPKDKDGNFGVGVYFSPDGLRWEAYSGNPVLHGTSDVHTLLGWDERIQQYVGYFRPGSSQKLAPPAGNGPTRIIGYSTSPDFQRWTTIKPALVPDELDPVDTQFYGMPAMYHEGIYFGFPWVFRTNLITHVAQLVHSRDGLHFTRTPFRNDVVPLGPTGAFDDGNAYMGKPVVNDGKLWIYYTGTRWRGAEDLFDLGDDVRDSIGLAILPLDGFASIEAGPNVGTLSTRSLVFDGKDLIVNLEASRKGYGIDDATSLRVEILDESGKPIPGFALEQAVTLISTNVAQVVKWEGNPSLSALAGRVVKLRFHMRNVKLYAFQFR